MLVRQTIASSLVVLLVAQASFGQGVYSFGDLASINEDSLKDELNSLCQQTFQSEIGKIRLHEIVSAKWLELAIDETIDQAVDEAVAAVKRETSYWELLKSGWSEGGATKLTKTTTHRAFNSAIFRHGIENLAAAVADAMAEEFDRASQEAATSGLLAMEEFLGYHYSAALKPVFIEELAEAVRKADDVGDLIGDLDNTSIVGQHKTLVAGVGVIVGTQIARVIGRQIIRAMGNRIAGRIAGRVAGRIATGVIPVVGWIVGGGMILWDLIQGADGALPEIRRGLKDPHVKGLIREGLAAEIGSQLSAEAPEIARGISLEVFSRWADFKEKFALLLNLTQEHQSFKRLVDDASKEDLYKLSNLVTVTLDATGKDATIDAVERGWIGKAMNLPESSFEIISTVGSLESLLDWSKVAGSSLEGVARFGIHRHKSPDDFDRARLGKLLAVGDMTAISKLVLLDNDRLADVLTITSFHLAALGQTLDTSDFEQLGWYLETGDDEMINAVIVGLKENPALRSRLGDETFKDLLATSSDKSAFISFLESSGTYLDMFQQAGSVLRGELSLGAYLHKYRVVTIAWFVLSLAAIAFALVVGVSLLLKGAIPLRLRRGSAGRRHGR